MEVEYSRHWLISGRIWLAMTRSADIRRLTCAGEFYTDLIFFDLDSLPRLGEETKTDNFAISLGGGAAITACAAARLDRPSELVTVWGDSMLDASARRRLMEVGVTCSRSPQMREVTTGVTAAVSTREDRYFLTHPGANRFVEEFLLRSETLARVAWAGHVHFALTPSRWGPFRKKVRQLRSDGLTVSWDLGWNPAAGRSRGFLNLCRELDVLFLNEMEACRYAGVNSVREAVSHFAHAENTVVIKQGSSGAIAAEKAASPIRATAIDVDAIESTGAGDAFNGGFLHAWMDGKAVEHCLMAGNICGGLSTRSPGGIQSLPSRGEFERRFNRLAG